MKRWSVKEWWDITPEQLERAKARTPRDTGISVGGSVVHKPRRALWMAKLELLARRLTPYFGRRTQAKIVDHDEEMRRWGRHDFVKYPTADDLAKVELIGDSIISSIEPGESVEIRIPTRIGKETP